MSKSQKSDKPSAQNPEKPYLIYEKPLIPLTNYSLSTICPQCASDTYKLACKVRCPKCGFMWDCSEL